MVITVQNNDVIILGAGIAGISAGYHLTQKNIRCKLFERDNDWGGLCGNFTIDGFRFDRFVHFTFPDDDYTRNIFEQSSPTYSHPSVSSNYWHGYWLKHPAQDNLAPLPTEDKVNIISDFCNRKVLDIDDIHDYEQWLRVQYGDYFAEHFPFLYTKKYWGVEPHELGTEWVGKRMHVPLLQDVLRGAFETQDKNYYYTNFMRYPKVGGFRSLLDTCRKGLDISFNKCAVRIIPDKHIVEFQDGTKCEYSRLISTLPLPEIVKMVDSCPEHVIKAAEQLRWTSGYQISLGFNRPDVAKYLWFYIYDMDVPPARVYSPNLKSPDNVPEGCSSIQAEVFWDSHNTQPDMKKTLDATVEKLKSICSFQDKDIIVKDIRMERYANVTFVHGTYENRQIVLDYLKSVGIESIGRFGKWEYFWSHQAFESGRNVK